MTPETLYDWMIALTERYFTGATVIRGRLSGTAKIPATLVTVDMGTLRRSRDAVREVVDGSYVIHRPAELPFTINLYTNGKAVTGLESVVAPRGNTAIPDMNAFVDYLDSDYVTDACAQENISLQAGMVQDLTGILKDSNYNYRSMIEVVVSFTHTVTGYTGVLSEDGAYAQTASGGGSEELAKLTMGWFNQSQVSCKEEEEV